MSPKTMDWQFRRRIVRAATRKRNGTEGGLRRPAHRETPLSDAEIFYGVQHGLIRIPPLERA